MMPRVLGWLHQEPMELEGLVVLVAVGIGAVPIYAAQLVAMVVRLRVVACRVAGSVPGVRLTVPHHRR